MVGSMELRILCNLCSAVMILWKVHPIASRTLCPTHTAIFTLAYNVITVPQHTRISHTLWHESCRMLGLYLQVADSASVCHLNILHFTFRDTPRCQYICFDSHRNIQALRHRGGLRDRLAIARPDHIF